MDSVGNPRTFVPYINTEDCSQGFCSVNCPQWCYIIFPPPPPLEFPDDRDSPSSFSPLWITIVGILASAFILVSYYAIISKYCRNSTSSTRQENQHSNHESEGNNWNTSLHEAWETMNNSGLEEGLIKSISVCRYKKGGKLIEGTECCVCLNEFQDGEDLRVLPKCPHAFHVNCIDTWLRSHSNCPLCRSNIALLSPPTDPVTTVDEQHRANETDAAEENRGRNVQDAEGDEVERDVVIDIPEEDQRGMRRRSVSMDVSSTVRRSIYVADILEIDDDDDDEVGELNHEKDENLVLGRMKRSHSSGLLRLPC